jgi:ubiquinone/menaquinone biosynthesis C-methylase UbiE
MSDDIKTCCATLYESDFARMLLGDSFHPGGLRLTERLGEKLGLGPGMRVLDVASGKGESAIFLARRFGSEVVGIDYGPENVKQAEARATEAGVGLLVRFRQGDAEKLGFPNASFDAVLCECAFCTFPDKEVAAAEFARVLRPGGRIGLSDLTRLAKLPEELQGLLAWVACIADARPVEEYVGYIEAAGIRNVEVETHDEALAELVRNIQGKLLGAELMSKLKKLDLEGIDFAKARVLARAASEAVRTHRLGYALVVGQRA